MNKEKLSELMDYFIDNTAFDSTNEQRGYLRQFQQCLDAYLDTEEKEQQKKRQRLLRDLNRLSKDWDAEVTHGRADDLIISYIDDKTITRAYDRIPKYYA